MKYQSTLKWLLPLIGILSFIAAGMGLFYPAPGQPYPYTTLRGEQVQINAQGLYFYDTVSSAAQMQANDFITLVLGLPLLVVSTWLAMRGSLRGRLLLTGTLGFFLYTYASMAFNTAFNMLFLLYVLLMTASLYAFIFAMMSFDLDDLPRHFSPRLPRKAIAAVLFAMGGFLFLAWTGRVMQPLLNHTPPPMENGITMVIQVMDLGLVTPLAVLGGVLLLKRSPWGYLLSAVMLLKGLTMSIAVSSMAINMTLRGTPESPLLMGIFLVLTLMNVIAALVLLRNIDEGAAVTHPAANTSAAR